MAGSELAPAWDELREQPRVRRPLLQSAKGQASTGQIHARQAHALSFGGSLTRLVLLTALDTVARARRSSPPNTQPAEVENLDQVYAVMSAEGRESESRSLHACSGCAPQRQRFRPLLSARASEHESRRYRDAASSVACNLLEDLVLAAIEPYIYDPGFVRAVVRAGPTEAQ